MKTGLFKTLADKDWLSLSTTAGSTSSCYADKDRLSMSITVGSSSSCCEVGEEQMSNYTWNPQRECSGSINNLDSQEQERKRLSALKKWEIALARARGLTEEKFISLSIPGSSSSSYDERKMELKKGNHASESSCGSGNCTGFQGREKLRLPGLRKCGMLLEIARGSNTEKWLSLSIPGSSSCSEGTEKKLKEKGSQNSLGSSCHSSSITEEYFLHNKKRKATQEIADESIANTKLRITESSSEEKQQEEESRQRELYLKKGKQKIGDLYDNGSQYKRLPSTEAAERGWLEVVFHMGVTRPELYLSKRVTRSDAKLEQHRFQLTQADIEKAMQPLQHLAEQARINAVPVKVLDKKGNKHDLILKYLQSSHTYRFMGVGYTNFLRTSKLKENEMMSIWGLPAGSSGVKGENWLAFVNSDETNN